MCLFCLKFIFKIVIFFMSAVHRPSTTPTCTSTEKGLEHLIGINITTESMTMAFEVFKVYATVISWPFLCICENKFYIFFTNFCKIIKKLYIFHDIFYLTRYHRLHQLLWIFFRVLSFHRLMLRHADLDDGLRLVFWKIRSIMY